MRRQDGGAGCGARGLVSQTGTREASGSRPGPLRGSAFNGWSGTDDGGRKPVRAEAERLQPFPEARPRGQKSRVARREAPRTPVGART